jgi:cholesterol transport system auxiliary component
MLKNALSRLAWLSCCLVLAACATPQAPTPKAVFDFGPILALPTTNLAAKLPIAAPISLSEIDSGAGLDSTALLYRLGYADAQQLRPYAQARWSVPPSQLIWARLRDAFAVHGPVLGPAPMTPWVLKVELEEFSQLFVSPQASLGMIRLRATLFQADRLVAQTNILVRTNAPSPDASGGVKALTAAADDAVAQMVRWARQEMGS